MPMADASRSLGRSDKPADRGSAEPSWRLFRALDKGLAQVKAAGKGATGDGALKTVMRRGQWPM
jgi:hypothetical protein